MIIQSELHRILDYNPDTGIFKWKISPAHNVKKGTVAGSKGTRGYHSICINKKMYLTHRLVWLYVYGYFPENYIDHIDRDKSNNRISNLREVSNQCNQRNCGNWTTNKSGVRGVYWTVKPKRWRAHVTIKGKTYQLGTFKDFDEAVCHRLAAEQCVNWSGCDSNSPAYKYLKSIGLCRISNGK